MVSWLAVGCLVSGWVVIGEWLVDWLVDWLVVLFGWFFFSFNSESHSMA